MEIFIVSATAFGVAIVTLFSGFGLGTVLMPVFALFFPLPVAIGATAVVHLANNLFKIALVGKFARWDVVLKFGLPAAVFSALGAYLLGSLAEVPPLGTYMIGGHEFSVTLIGLSIGLIIAASSAFELVPALSHLSFSSKFIPLGGILSGFFGGISGNQGILRSAFLIKAGLGKEGFVGTGVVCGTIVDIVRLAVYGWAIFSVKFHEGPFSEMKGLLISACLFAFLGSFIGTKLLHKMTLNTLKLIVGTLLLILGLGIAGGIV